MLIREQLAEVAMLHAWCWLEEIRYKAYFPADTVKLFIAGNELFDVFDKHRKSRTGPVDTVKLIRHMLDELVKDGKGLNPDMVNMYPALRQAQAALEAAINQVVPDLEV